MPLHGEIQGQCTVAQSASELVERILACATWLSMAIVAESMEWKQIAGFSNPSPEQGCTASAKIYHPHPHQVSMLETRDTSTCRRHAAMEMFGNCLFKQNPYKTRDCESLAGMQVVDLHASHDLSKTW